jgi:hypothetical protein
VIRQNAFIGRFFDYRLNLRKDYSMKTSIKLAVASLLVVGGVANAANINTLPTASTGSSLVLLLKDVTTSTYYAEVLNAVVTDVNSYAKTTSDPAEKYSLNGDSVTGSLNVPSLFGSYTSANLNSFINSGGNSSANTFVWTVMGSRQDANNITGKQSIVVTSAQDLLNDVQFGGADINGAANGVNLFFVNELNTATLTNGKTNGAGWGTGTFGAQAPGSFVYTDQNNGAGLGVGQYLYQLAGSTADAANIYKSVALLTLNSNGTISYTGADLAAGTSPVPVPAAVWLLGSGLAGLAGIGRRRKLVA